MKFEKSKKGIALFFTIVVLGLLLIGAFLVSQIVTSQIKIQRELGYSVKAFYGADSGVEDAFYKIYVQQQNLPFSFSGSFSEVSYEGNASTSSSCPSGTQWYCIRSLGKFKEFSREVEVWR